MIIDEIMHIDGCETTKSRAVAVLRTQAGLRVYFAKGVLSRPQQIKLAADLLKTMPRNAVRDALMARLRISRGIAYELINRALKAPRAQQISLL
jgi:hypothetical protein